jgi:hypothetical protein
MDDIEFISNNTKINSSFCDFWLMQNCKNSIIANSTFSWWAAWMSYMKFSGLVIFPKEAAKSKIPWSIDGRILSKWYSINV